LVKDIRFLFIGLMWAGALAIVAEPVGAQWQPTTRYTVREGLAQSQVSDLDQDEDGYLWIATEGGLSRFDGLRFTLFGPEDGLPDSVVNAIDVVDGTLWAGGQDGGLARLVRGRFEPVPGYPLDESVPVFAIERLGENGVVIGTEAGLLALRDGEWTQLLDEIIVTATRLADGGVVVMGRRAHLVAPDLTVTPLDFPGGDQVPVAATTGADDTWLADIDGRLHRLRDGRTIQLAIEPDSEMRQLLGSRHGRFLWIGTNRGLFTWAPGDPPTALVPVALQPESVPTEISHLMEDREGNLWVATWGRGLYRVDRSPWTVFTRQTGMPASGIWSFTEDASGCTWMGTDDNGALRWCDDRWSGHLTTENGLPSPIVFSVVHDHRRTLWLGGPEGVCRWDGAMTCWTDAEVMPDPFVSDVVVTPSGEVWIGTDRGAAVLRGDRWVVPPGVEDLPSTLIRDLTVSPNGAVWGVLDEGGIAVFSATGASLAVAAADGLPTDRIWSLAHARDGAVLVGTDQGLWIHDPSGEEPNRFVDRSAGLPSSSVISVLETPDQRIWVGTSTGVARVDRSGVVTDVFTSHDGLSGTEAAQGGLFLHSSGDLWIGMAEGATLVNTERLADRSEVAPELVVESILLNGEPIPDFSPRSTAGPADHPPVVVGPDITHIRFTFTAPVFTAPELVRFRHIITADQHGFTPPEPDRHLTVHLPPAGRYRFGLAAVTGHGNPSRGPLWIDLDVRPQWYASWWFRITAVALTLVIAAVLAASRSRAHQARRDALEDEVRIRTSDLDAANRRIKEQNQLLTELSRTDPLTGLGNRRVLSERLPLAMALARRDLLRSPSQDLAAFHGLVVAMIDLDRFKRVNDTWGHETGDRLLADLARNIGSGLREGDQAIRWGGEEFIVLSHGLDRDKTSAFIHRVLDQLAVGRTTNPSGDEITVVASVGFISYPLGDRDFKDREHWTQLVDLADRMLYEAKSRGRGRACGVVWRPQSGSDWSESTLFDAVLEAPSSPPPPMEFLEIEGTVKSSFPRRR
jgi:diguanylate cyclase (GGDEF)-like protein